MAETVEMKIIARIRSDFSAKFGIPRQSGLVESLRAEVVFAPEYRNPDAFRGLSLYSHIWLLWGFNEAVRENWSATVRPPRLGGNERVGVFATRSPFRPNAIGLSCVRLLEVDLSAPEGPILRVGGADLLNGSPIFDVKPYLPYVDAHPEATGGIALQRREGTLQVDIPPELLRRIPEDRRQALLDVLAQDPRPGYQHDPTRAYGMEFAGFDVRFVVEGDRLRVREIVPLRG
ncbi:MAG: tRNA (N6-threonylcarbamoyladenosine(37)-N6)-methyltransferase TrmO [Candidatus Spyradocola sp.]|jgi:tRNA-Thr(GGU) m(6)t(6)A37 methyltransferase TsaA